MSEQTANKASLADKMNLVTVKIELAQPFVDFIEEYRRFFNCELTTEQIFM
jgi:hypothetical protein